MIKLNSFKALLVGVRIVCGVVISKFLAMLVGPEGFVLFGNLRDFLRSVQAGSTLGMYRGAVKYIVQVREDLLKLSQGISTGYYIGYVSTFVLAFLCYFFASEINTFLFTGFSNYTYIIKVLGATLPFYALNRFTFSIMEGFPNQRMFKLIRLLGYLLVTAIFVVLVVNNGLEGALLTVVLAELLIFLIVFVGIINRRSLIPLIKMSMVNRTSFKKMGYYSLMVLFSAVVLPLVTIVVRKYIVTEVGMKEAGFWQAMNQISRYSFVFVLSLLTAYVLPKLTKANSALEFRSTVYKFYKTLIPPLFFGLATMYLFRDIIIAVVLNSEFKPVADLFLWQLAGDFFKILSLFIGYQFLVKRMLWHYLITEAFMVVTLYTASLYFIDLYGVKGANIAYFVTQVLYFVIVFLIFGSPMFKVLSVEGDVVGERD